MSIDSFKEFLATAKAGERFVYHEGFNCSKSALAADAWAAYEQGLVNLAQKRVRCAVDNSPGVFEYIAEARNRTTIAGTPRS